MIRRALVGALVLALVAVACSWGTGVEPEASTSVPEPTTTTTTEAPPTTTTVPGDPTTTSTTEGGEVGGAVEVRTCVDPGEGDTLLCSAYEIFTREYIDPIPDAELAAAAARGVTEASDTDDGGSDPVVCVIPNDDFRSVCDAMADRLAVDPESEGTLVEMAIAGMLTFAEDDPNTIYMNPEQMARHNEDLGGSVEGIGALVRSEEPDGTQCVDLDDTCRLVIVAVLEDSPAESEGILDGDVIVSVDGEPVAGRTVDDVVAVVRGPAGTTVSLGIDRDGDLLTVDVVRDRVDIPVADGWVLEPGIGYIELQIFNSRSAPLVRDEIDYLLDEGVEGIVLDLRDNPGGTLPAAIEVASEFISEGVIMRSTGDALPASYSALPGGLATDRSIELVVLVDRGSASASEVVAGALQDTGRAILIGEPTFGKNTVQQIFGLPNGGALRVTVARWTTPDGNDYGGVGLTPDILLVDADPNDSDDEILEAAIDALRN